MNADHVGNPQPVPDQKELLSAFMDGELDPASAAACLQRACSEAGAADDWRMWHAVGDALRSSDTAACHRAGFERRLADRLRDEPVVLAPRARTGARKVVRRLVLPAAAAGAAALVLAVVAVPQLRVASVQPAVADAPAGAVAVRAAPAAQGQDIEPYLAAHREASGALGMPRTTHYLRTTSIQPASER